MYMARTDGMRDMVYVYPRVSFKRTVNREGLGSEEAEGGK
jgi:hypothetical protein